MKLSEMRRLLATHQLQLTRSLGQSFLHDANQLERIVHLAQLESVDGVLEIGPGLGPLTERLAQCCRHVLAIEKDRRLIRLLEQRLQHLPNLTLQHADALEFLRQQESQDKDWSDWKLVSNLPYSVASPILVQLTEGNLGPKRMVVTLQQEVVQRLIAAPSSPEYGQLTLLVQAGYRPMEHFRIPASCFFPEPEVISACVVLEKRSEPAVPTCLWPTFKAVVKRSFSQRRKMAFKLLKTDWPTDQLVAAFGDCSLSTNARAENFSLADFTALSRALHPQTTHAA